MDIYNRAKSAVVKAADTKVRVGDAVLVGSLVYIAMLTLLIRKGNVHISFSR